MPAMLAIAWCMGSFAEVFCTSRKRCTFVLSTIPGFNAKGMFLAAAAAAPVYELLGKKGMGTVEFPKIETPMIDDDIALRQHSGGHTPGPNWPTFLKFTQRYFSIPAPGNSQRRRTQE